MDLAYIKKHPGSYLSVYLLFQHKRKISVDSVQACFNLLSKYVKKSTLGYAILQYVYPLTDDNEFRKANPLVNLEFDQRLNKLKSVYELN
jgi:hypothetical protein